MASLVLREESVFVDIGANRGDYAAIASRYVDPKNMFLFEPIKKMAKALRTNFPKSTVVEKCCSNENKTTIFFQSNNDELSGLRKRELNSLPANSQYTSFDVETITLDSYFKKKCNIDLVKIDVEGAEILVLEGMSRILQKKRPIVFVEHGTNGPEYFGNSYLDFWRLSQKMNYGVMTVDGQPINSLATMEESFKNWPIWNYLLYPDERRPL